MLRLVVESIAVQSGDIVSLELVDPTGASLPAWEPGAHIDLQLVTRQQRQYTLCGDPADLRSYRIAVLREELSRGASMYIHSYLRAGRTVHASAPRNLFPVLPAERYLLLAAGIGITPILPMARALAAGGADWSLNYAVRSDAHLPFRDELAALGDRVTVTSRERTGRLDLARLLAEPQDGVAVYSCGPARFTDAVEAAMAHWPRGSLHLERFEPRAVVARPNAPFTVRLARSGGSVDVPAEQSMLQALNARDIPVPGSCLRGVCGSCVVRVLDGAVDHRDSLTSGDETAVVYPCVSRARGSQITVDL
jgi:ferredoxin-NADP reductase